MRINYIVRCDECALWDRERNSLTLWRWRPDGVFSRFAVVDQELPVDFFRNAATLAGLCPDSRAVTEIDCSMVGDGMCMFLVTREHPELEAAEFSEYLLAFKEQRRQVVMQKLQAIARGLLPRMELRRARAEAALEREVQHYVKNAISSLADTQEEIVEKLPKREEDPQAVALANTQRLRLLLIGQFLRLRQGVQNLARSPSLDCSASDPRRSWMELRDVLETVYLHVLLSTKAVSAALMDVGLDSRRIDEICDAMIAMTNQCARADTTRPATLIREETPYRVITDLVAQRRMSYKFRLDGRPGYGVLLADEEFAHAYTALTEIVDNCIKDKAKGEGKKETGKPCLIAEIHRDELEDVLLFTSARQFSQAVDERGETWTYRRLRSFLSDELPSGGLGMDIIRMSLNRLGCRVSVASGETLGLVPESYFWYAVHIPRDRGRWAAS